MVVWAHFQLFWVLWRGLKRCCKQNTVQTVPDLQFWFSDVWERGVKQAKDLTEIVENKTYKAKSFNILSACRLSLQVMCKARYCLREKT